MFEGLADCRTGLFRIGKMCRSASVPLPAILCAKIVFTQGAIDITSLAVFTGVFQKLGFLLEQV